MTRTTIKAKTTYQPSPIKRHRFTKAEVERRRRPASQTARKVFYQATVQGIGEKTRPITEEKGSKI